MKNIATNGPVKTTINDNECTLISSYDIWLFTSGKHFRLYEHLGAHKVNFQGQAGCLFAVWAPNTRYVSLVADFNDWNRGSHPMHARLDGSGIWELFVPGIANGAAYKYYIESHNGYKVEKGDPYAFSWELPPATASIVADLNYDWNDSSWMEKRFKKDLYKSPVSIYEVHIGSWKRPGNDPLKFLTYKELAATLPAYCREMGFTHVELMPVMEHPFYASWGYQITGYFAPSSRYGSPQDFMYMIDAFHQAGIGVILDWVPSHFTTDEHGLGYFDGTHLYEHEDPRQGFHPEWTSFVFNFGRHEVKSFLISNALYWLEKYHIDGLRVDAVASMLMLNYARKDGDWIPNKYGGKENLEAISFLKDFNEAIREHYPDVMTIAEDSTDWPGVTKPVAEDGLGFSMKWMMGWMHDTLDYFKADPIYRKTVHDKLTFSIMYAFSEKYVLPFSHDEVVHEKRSLINRMPGDAWRQFANLRLLFGYMYGHPGAKLLFMGGEFGQRREWQHDYSLDWHELNNPMHAGVQQWVKALNELYTGSPAMYEYNYEWDGFEWLDVQDKDNSVISWMRKGADEEDHLLFIGNFTPVVRYDYKIGVPHAGSYIEILNSDDSKYGGSNVLNDTNIETEAVTIHGKEQSISLTLPPLSLIVFKHILRLD